MLAKSKLNSIETLISQALIDMKISHEEFITILNEKDKYEKMRDNLRSGDEKNVLMTLVGSNVLNYEIEQYVRTKDTSCKATYKVKDWSEKLLSIL